MGLDDLNLNSKVIRVLSKNGWTVETLATTNPSKLSVIPGIGNKTAVSVIKAARAIVNVELLEESKKVEYNPPPDAPSQRSVRVRRIYGEKV